MDSDCAVGAPVCDLGSCRACEKDAECSSGACGDNGSCLAEADIVYVDVTGVDVGTCTRASPCLTVQYAVQNALPNRSQIVLAPGTYAGYISITSVDTSAPAITIHGGGATLKPVAGSDLGTIYVGNVATTMRDLTFEDNQNGGGTSVTCSSAPCSVTNVKVNGVSGFQVGINMTLNNVEIINAYNGIDITNGAHLLMDRVSIHGGVNGILVPGAATDSPIVSISNLLLYDLTGTALGAATVTGTIQFATIARNAANGSSPAVVHCSAGLTIQSSVLWTANGQLPLEGGCSVTNSIVGPVTVGANENTDPLFLDEAHRDFHLSAASPAIDKLASGPATDLDGTARPQGARFDLGAFEYKP